MIGDSSEVVWRSAVKKICAFRSKSQIFLIENDSFKGEFVEPTTNCQESSAIRKFLIPKINFRAISYHKIINLNLSDFTNPPVTKTFSSEEIYKLRFQPLHLDHPCHSQAFTR